MPLNPLIIILIIFSIAGAFFLLATFEALSKLRIIRAFRTALPTLLCLLIAALSGVLLIANHGYHSFTKETLVATVFIEPQGYQQFKVSIVLPDSSKVENTFAGDMFYIDAHILKWHPLLNIIGVHTTYELDRIGGRYYSLDDEKNKQRTICSLAKNKLVDMYSLRRRFAALKPFLDAEYGSATFTGAEKAKILYVMVSTSGLLVRESID